MPSPSGDSAGEGLRRRTAPPVAAKAATAAAASASGPAGRATATGAPADTGPGPVAATAIVLAAAAVGALAMTAFAATGGRLEPGGPGGASSSSSSVRRLRLADTTADGSFDPWAVAAGREPVVLEDSWAARAWGATPARGRGFWSLRAVASRCERETAKVLGDHVFAQEGNGTFVMFRGGSADATAGASLSSIGGLHGVMRVEGEYDSVRVEQGLSLEDIAHPPPGKYRYLFGPAEAYCDDIVTSIPGFERLFLSEPRFRSLMERVKPTPAIWASSANVTAQLHYDPSHNFHMLLSGTKHVTLYPPEEWRRVRLYPSIHPAHRQLQRGARPPECPSSKVFALRAGEMLYIPPFWFHEIRTGDGAGGALSVTIISPSADEILYTTYVKNALVKELQSAPFHAPGASRHGRLIQAFGLLGAIFAQISQSATETASIASMFEALRESRHTSLLSVTPDKCRTQMPRCFGLDLQDSDAAAGIKTFASLDRISSLARKFGGAISQIQTEGAKQIVLGNLIETVVAWALTTTTEEGASHVPCFLNSCCALQSLQSLEDL